MATGPAYRVAADCVGDDTCHATFYGKDRQNQLARLTLFAIGAHAGDETAPRGNGSAP